MTTTVLGLTNTHCEPKGTVADIYIYIYMYMCFKIHMLRTPCHLHTCVSVALYLARSVCAGNWTIAGWPWLGMWPLQMFVARWLLGGCIGGRKA